MKWKKKWEKFESNLCSLKFVKIINFPENSSVPISTRHSTGSLTVWPGRFTSTREYANSSFRSPAGRPLNANRLSRYKFLKRMQFLSLDDISVDAVVVVCGRHRRDRPSNERCFIIIYNQTSAADYSSLYLFTFQFYSIMFTATL